MRWHLCDHSRGAGPTPSPDAECRKAKQRSQPMPIGRTHAIGTCVYLETTMRTRGMERACSVRSTHSMMCADEPRSTSRRVSAPGTGNAKRGGGGIGLMGG